jgi:hypothetical protein
LPNLIFAPSKTSQAPVNSFRLEWLYFAHLLPETAQTAKSCKVKLQAERGLGLSKNPNHCPPVAPRVLKQHKRLILLA